MNGSRQFFCWSLEWVVGGDVEMEEPEYHYLIIPYYTISSILNNDSKFYVDLISGSEIKVNTFWSIGLSFDVMFCKAAKDRHQVIKPLASMT